MNRTSTLLIKEQLPGDWKLRNYIQGTKDSKCINIITNIFSSYFTSLL